MPTKPKKMRKVKSLGDVYHLATIDVRYKELMIRTASNLGGETNNRDLQTAYNWLVTNATDAEAGGVEDGEAGVVAEVNFMLRMNPELHTFTE